MATKTFTAVIHKEEDIYVAECPEVGTVSQEKVLRKRDHFLKEATLALSTGISTAKTKPTPL